MSDILYLTSRRNKTPRTRVPPMNFEAVRRQALSPEEVAARTVKDEALSAFYGSRKSDTEMIPFFAYAQLDAAGRTHSLRMPNHAHYMLDHPKDTQDLAGGAQLGSSVITEAHWWGITGNEPWAGLPDPIGFCRGTILSICERLRAAGCEIRVLPKLSIELHTRFEHEFSQSQLELFFSSRRMIEILRSK